MDDIIEISRRQRKRRELHRTLLQTAAELFRERGVARTTVDDIAEAADVARQTVFNHFPYKEALALELGGSSVQLAAERAHALLEAGTPALEVLQCAAGWILDAAVEERDIATTVARELLHPEPDRAVRAAEHVPLEKLFTAILEQAREEGELREELPIDVVASRLTCVITSLIAEASSCEASLLKRKLLISFDIVFNGIAKRSA